MSKNPILVVDLDGTLIRSDMLFESFWAALAKDWRSLFTVLMSIKNGLAAIKKCLAELVETDASLLPYNNSVIQYIKDWRKSGGRTALVTASDQIIAAQIAEYLDLFDEVHGSDGQTNLKGSRKAVFLENHYGHCGFIYIGDTTADLPVWERSDKAVIVSSSKSLITRVESLKNDVEQIPTNKPKFADYLKAIRPHQWLKNILVFLPMVAAHQITIETIGKSLLAFVSFCFIASSVYLVNDLLDLSADRAHARKRNRPIASGTIPISHGSMMAPAMFLLGFAFALPFGLYFILVMLGYYFMTTAYSLYFKRRVIIDICILAGLYSMRIIAGGIATEIPLSVWLLAFSIFFFFSLAAVKRQAELVDGYTSGLLTAHGRGYHIDDRLIVTIMAITSGYISILIFSLYVNSPEVKELYSEPYVLWGICLVLLFWISKIVMVTHRGQMHDDPLVYAVQDRDSLISLLLILIFLIGGTYL